MTQEFFKQYDDARKLIRGINEDLSSRDKLINQDQSTAKINQVLEKQLSQLSNHVNSLLTSMSKPQSQQEYVITKPELERRRKMVFELKNSLDSLNKKMNKSRFDSKVTADLFKPSNLPSYRDSRDFSSVSIDTLKEEKRTFDVEFDKKVFQLSDATSNLKKEQEAMSDELTYQNQSLLPDIETQIDRNNIKLIKNNSKLVKILKKGSECKLWLFLSFELIVLILLLVY